MPLETLLRGAAGLPPQVPLFIENGAKTLGQAEMWFGAGRGARHAVIALIGSGVGACIVTDGALYGGAHSSAGEWGHTTAAGPRAPLPLRGAAAAWRRTSGAEAVLERWARGRRRPPAGADEETALAALLGRATRRRRAPPTRRRSRCWTRPRSTSAPGIADLVNLFNPERIIISGWAGLLLGRHFLPAVRQSAAAYALRHPAERTTIELGSSARTRSRWAPRRCRWPTS